MSKKQKTLWSDEHKKFKPVNMQAVKIMFPAKGLNCPPEEEKKPVIVGTLQQRLAAELEAESAARRARIEAYDKEEAEREAKRKERRIAEKEQKKIAYGRKGVSPNKVMEMYLRKMMKRHIKNGWKPPLALMAGGPVPKKP